jgi:hypothetical protein
MFQKLCCVVIVAIALALAPAAFAAKSKGHKHGHGHYHHHHGHAHYHSGYHYKSAPRGWNRYQYRPLGWQARGCVVVGPVWYCPW